MPTFPESAPEPNSSACPRLTWRARPSPPPSAVALRLHPSWPLTVLITRCEFGRVRYPLQRAKISRVQSLDPVLIRPARNVRYDRCRGSDPQSQVRRDIWSRSRSEPASRRSVFDVRRPVSGECVQGSTDSHALRLPNQETSRAIADVMLPDAALSRRTAITWPGLETCRVRDPAGCLCLGSSAFLSNSPYGHHSLASYSSTLPSANEHF